jgi:hypothetical protein
MGFLDPCSHQGHFGMEHIVPLGLDAAARWTIDSHEHIRVVDCDLTWT